MATTVGALAQLINAEIRGNADLAIEGAQSLEKARPAEISFAVGEKNLKKLRRSKAGAAIVGRDLAALLAAEPCSATLLIVDDAASCFLQLLARFKPPRSRKAIGISPKAEIAASARIGANTNIHPGATIGEDVVIGSGCEIHPGVVIGDGCRIGDHVTLFANVVLYHDVVLGNHVAIHACSVIGADGFGYRLVNGRHVKLPHFGAVRIEDHVEIGSCTTIDRAMIGETVIGEGTKIDNQVMVAHNCELGKHNILVAKVGFAGSVTTGDYVVCAAEVGVADHVNIGERCTLGSRSGVHKDIPPGQTYLGAPAQPAAEAVKVIMAQRKLPEMRSKLRELEETIATLTAKIDELASGKTRAA